MKDLTSIEWPKSYDQAASEQIALHPIVLRRLELLADSGITVSIAYGYCGDSGKLWSVDMIHQSGGLAKPIGAESFQQAVWIADKEAKERGWVSEQNDLALPQTERPKL